jgi:hypothetical protein
MPIRLTVGAGVAVLCGVILTLAALASPVHAQGQGNSAAAKQCQHGGWKDLTTLDERAFKNQGDCTSYASRGGTLVPEAPNPWARACVEYGGTFEDGADWTCHDIGRDGADYLFRLCTEVDGTQTDNSIPGEEPFDVTCSF